LYRNLANYGTINLNLYGSNYLCMEDNFAVFISVHKFIKDSGKLNL